MGSDGSGGRDPRGGGAGGGGGGGPQGFETAAQQFGTGDDGSQYFVIFGFDGEILATSQPAAFVPDPGPTMNPPAPGLSHSRQRGEWREAYTYGPFGTRLVVGKSIAPEQSQLRSAALYLGATSAGVLLLGLAGGWFLSRRAVKPIRVITSVARDISASNLSRRIDTVGIQSELGMLATVLNATFARLEAAFAQQVQFTADASHELRTPLAVIHTHAQLALSRERTAEEYKKTLATCLRASTRMKALVDSLLLLASADAGNLSLDPQPHGFAGCRGGLRGQLVAQPLGRRKQHHDSHPDRQRGIDRRCHAHLPGGDQSPDQRHPL